MFFVDFYFRWIEDKEEEDEEEEDEDEEYWYVVKGRHLIITLLFV